jgi:hypothetical protein
MMFYIHTGPQKCQYTLRTYIVLNCTHLLQLLNEGEFAPGMGMDELRQRRQRLADIMPECSVAVLPSAPQRYMAGVIPYTYRQDADFRYLTGVTQQGLAIFHKGAAGSGASSSSWHRQCAQAVAAGTA